MTVLSDHDREQIRAMLAQGKTVDFVANYTRKPRPIVIEEGFGAGMRYTAKDDVFTARPIALDLADGVERPDVHPDRPLPKKPTEVPSRLLPPKPAVSVPAQRASSEMAKPARPKDDEPPRVLEELRTPSAETDDELAVRAALAAASKCTGDKVIGRERARLMDAARRIVARVDKLQSQARLRAEREALLAKLAALDSEIGWERYTPEGKAKVRAANMARWAAYHARVAELGDPDEVWAWCRAQGLVKSGRGNARLTNAALDAFEAAHPRAEVSS
jgi:hypothetical protein